MDEARFSRCWPLSNAHEVHAELVRRWSEPHRHYHTLEHLDECLAWLDATRAHAQRPDELELALYFHDVIYEPMRSDNEFASAALFRQWMPNERVCALILSTAKHEGDGDTALLADIDLAILGASPARYDRFERDVRREYAMFDDAQWRSGRARVLRGFLERLAIYQTAPFQRLEAQARDNLARALRLYT